MAGQPLLTIAVDWPGVLAEADGPTRRVDDPRGMLIAHLVTVSDRLCRVRIR